MAGTLHSDHVNYLILRYLQEFGHENAADAFLRDWNRPVEYRQPETFPFAHAVPRNELVSLIQNGLYLDELQARARKCERRFQWTRLEARNSAERQNGITENGDVSRPSSSDKRRDWTASAQRPGDFPLPVPKRQRRSAESEAQPNGDTMDIDADGTSDADADHDGTIVSPTNPSEAEVQGNVERYDSLDVATQTDNKIGHKMSTTLWKLDQPGASVLHSQWNPNVQSQNSRKLLAVGESLCRYYDIPVSLNDNEEITHIDEPSRPSDSVVTAMTWRPDGSAAACVLDPLSEPPHGGQPNPQLIVEHSPAGHSISYQLGPPLLQPPGVILSLRYSLNGKYLLAAHTSPDSESRGMVQIWATANLNLEAPQIPSQPIAWRVFENQVLDAVWLDDESFVVCGSQLSAVFQVDSSQSSGIKVDGTTEILRTATTCGIKALNSQLLDGKPEAFDKIYYDAQLDLAVFVSQERSMLQCRYALRKNTGETASRLEERIELSESGITSVAFQPLPKSNETDAMDVEISQKSLVVALSTGNFHVYSIATTEDGRCQHTASLRLIGESPALNLAWSPSGQYLAVGGTDLVQIWTADALKPRNGVRHSSDASLTWMLPSEANGLTNGHGPDDEQKLESEPSLSWSADGQNLAFAADKQIAVIRFRPPLHAEKPEVNVNGRPSP